MNLKDFEHLKSYPEVKFKEETVGGVDLVIPVYMVADNEFWKIPMALECRGHAFRKDTGELVSMAFHKFFNLNEKEDYLEKNVFDGDRMFEVLEKRDGSMITAVLIDDKVYFKTKKSFYSDVAILANELATENVLNVTEDLLKSNFSPIWEFTHPDWKIVVDYGNKPTWRLLAVRCMRDGTYWDWQQIRELCSLYRVECITKVDIKNIDMLKDNVKNMVGQEGYVVAFEDGFRVKMKCDWYNLRHHINTDLRERDVVKMCLEEKLDDIMPCIYEAGYDPELVFTIQRRFVQEMVSIVEATAGMARLIGDCSTRKDAALLYSKDEFFGLGMKLYEGKEPDYKKFWKNKYLDSYELKTVYTDFTKVPEDSF